MHRKNKGQLLKEKTEQLEGNTGGENKEKHIHPTKGQKEKVKRKSTVNKT